MDLTVFATAYDDAIFQLAAGISISDTLVTVNVNSKIPAGATKIYAYLITEESFGDKGIGTVETKEPVLITGVGGTDEVEFTITRGGSPAEFSKGAVLKVVFRSAWVSDFNEALIGGSSSLAFASIEIGGTRPSNEIFYIKGDIHLDAARSIMHNVYFDGAFKYVGNGAAYRVRISDNDYSWHTAPVNSSGPGAACTLTQKMRLSLGGDLEILDDKIRISSNGKGLLLGAGGNALVDYNGTDMVFDSQVEGSGNFLFNNGDVNLNLGSINLLAGNLNIIGTADSRIDSGTLNTPIALVMRADNTSQFLKVGINANVAEISFDDNDSFKIGQRNAHGDANLVTTYLEISAAGAIGFGVAPLANMASGDAVLEGGSLVLKEITTPTADANYAKVYPKANNKLYFQDGAGAEHEIAFV